MEIGVRSFRRFVVAALAVGLGIAPGVPAQAAPGACPRAAVARGTLPRYELRVTVQPAERKLTGKALVTLPPAAEARERVRFKLRRDMGTPRIAVVAPAALAGPATVTALPSDKTDADAEWELRLRRPLPAGQSLKLQIDYAGGAETSLNFNVSAEGVFVGGGTTAWYPQFGARGLGELEVTVPEAFSVVATAARRSDTVQGGLRTAVFETGWPTHFSFTAGPYIVRRAQGRRPVTLYLLKDRPFADELVEVARRSLEVLEREFGPYPFSDFSVLEVAQEPAGKSGFLGAAYDGYFLVRSDFLDAKRADPGGFGHEIGHQWWGVSVEQAGSGGEYMLDEALANYGALLVTEELRGAAEGERFRRGGEGMGGGLEARRLIAAGLDHRLADLPKDPAFYALSDSKGYLVYDMLARLAGRERLRQALVRMACEHAYGSIDWKTFEAGLRQAPGPGTGWFFDQWLHRPGIPVLSHKWSQAGGRVELSVTQHGAAYRLELPVRFAFEDGSAEVRAVRLAGPVTQAAFAFPKRVAEVTLDPAYSVLHATPDEMAEAKAYEHSTRGQLLWDNGKTEEAKAELAAGLAARAGADHTGAEFSERLYLGWIAQLAGQADEALAQYERAAALPVRAPDLVPRLYLNIAQVLNSRGDKAGAAKAARAVIAAERAAGKATRITERAQMLLEEQGKR